MSLNGPILLVDDDPSLLKLLTMRLNASGYEVISTEHPTEVMGLIESRHPQVVISDLKMDEMDGLTLFGHIQKRHPTLPVILLTAHGSIPEAVSATQQGVFSFLTKPIDKNALLETLEKACSHYSTPDASETWRAAIITQSPLMETLLEQAKRVAEADVSILVSGASGTGKELMAQAIHLASPRNKKPFIAINCGALPEQLLESELFGHVKGAFTGAVTHHEGLFQAAHGGTLFLDEIGDMPYPLQVKLLRALQERQIRPLGSTKAVDIDVRIVSATHRNLKAAIEAKEFREDLFYRLNVVNLRLPSLRERAEDIPLLARYLLQRAASGHRSYVKGFSPDALALLSCASWPGNVRQLVNVVEQCVALTSTPMITEGLVSQALAEQAESFPSFIEARNQFERNYLIKVLKLTEGSASQAAKIAQRNRTDFYKLLARHNLEPADFKPGGSQHQPLPD
ncbi:response regulator GlrR [Pokkaliibacter plantistimulans]|uniref:Response regulator GlrR n=2 Tax=Pokkaliibacter plantistimulans TaxID=1635171 RepID=A0ABX5M1Y9_9GAMM|nr:response regulator GlrR [Pokkaliibacter plantistimulans]